jgi:hypothetical protein
VTHSVADPDVSPFVGMGYTSGQFETSEVLYLIEAWKVGDQTERDRLLIILIDYQGEDSPNCPVKQNKCQRMLACLFTV